MTSRAIIAPLAAGALCACGGSSAPVPESDGNWVQRVTTEGDVTTVRTLSGSRWRHAELVEEYSIGVDRGADETTFGALESVWVTDRHILLGDQLLDVVRLFDRQGSFLRAIGSRGEGPREYFSPERAMVLPDDRIVVADFEKLLFYAANGTHQASWPWPGDGSLVQREPLTLTADGNLWAVVVRRDDQSPTTQWDLSPHFAVRIGSGGATNQRIDFPVNERSTTRLPHRIDGVALAGPPVPFSPVVVRSLTSELSAIQGYSDRYAFQVVHRDGSTLFVERYWAPVAIDPEQVDWALQWQTRSVQSFDPEFHWPDVEVPRHHRAYFQFVDDRQGRIWVLSRGAAVRSPDCIDPAEDPDFRSPPCYSHEIRAAIFDGRDGTYYGELILPDGLRYWTLFVDGDLVAAAHEDGAGVQRAKIYRLQYAE